MQTNYLESVIRQSEYYKMEGERTFPQVPEEKLYWQYKEVFCQVSLNTP